MFLVLYFTCLLVAHSVPKKYDIGEESLRLHGTDLDGLMVRFRRTRDYARLVEDQIHELVALVKDISRQGMFFHFKGFSKEADEIAKEIPQYTLVAASTKDMTDAQILDWHLSIYQRRPLKIRNQLRRRGFELAEKVIDGCIATLSDNPAETRSTIAGMDNHYHDEESIGSE